MQKRFDAFLEQVRLFGSNLLFEVGFEFLLTLVSNPVSL